MSTKKIEIIRGDDTVLHTTFTDENGAVVDISSANLVFTAKNDYDSVVAISKTMASGLHTDPTNGVTDILLDHSITNVDAGDYYWDIQLTFGTGSISSVRNGKLIVVQDITT
jgi:hypothetical protein